MLINDEIAIIRKKIERYNRIQSLHDAGHSERDIAQIISTLYGDKMTRHFVSDKLNDVVNLFESLLDPISKSDDSLKLFN